VSITNTKEYIKETFNRQKAMVFQLKQKKRKGPEAKEWNEAQAYLED